MNETILARIRALTEKEPAALSVVLLDRKADEIARWTRGDLWQAARGAAQVLAEEGLRAGQVCGLILRHDPRFTATYLGAVMLGAIPAVLAWPTPRLHPEKFQQGLAGIAAHSGLDMIVTEPAFDAFVRPLLEPGRSSIRAVVHVRAGDPDRAPPIPKASPSTPFLLQHSSGTTGLQKPIMLSNRVVLGNVDAHAKANADRPDDVLVTWLPLYHDLGLVGNFLYGLCNGRPLYLLDTVEWTTDPSSVMVAMSRYRGTLNWMPNFAYVHLARRVSDAALEAVNARFDHVRGWISGGEPVRQSSLDAFATRFAPWGVRRDQIGAGYGMAEAVLVVSVSSRPPRELLVDHKAFERGKIEIANESGRSFVSSGKLVDGVELRIVDEQRKPLPENTLGEVAVGGAYLFDGYNKNPAKTAEVLVDGWYYSGDQGFVRDGEVYVVARLKDLIIVAGKNIAPEDIEYAAGEVPGIDGGRVVAFGALNESSGTEEVRLLAEVSGEIEDRQALALAVIAKVASQTDVTVAGVHFVPSRWLVKSSSGKPSRKANAQRFMNGEHSVAGSDGGKRTFVAPRSEAEKALAMIWSEVLGVPRVSVDDHLVTLGGDSLKASTIAARASAAGFEVTLPEILKLGTIENVARSAPYTPRAAADGGTVAREHVAPFSLCVMPEATLRAIRADASVADAYPVVDSQAQRLFQGVTSPVATWLQGISTTVSGPLDIEVFRSCWEKVIERHPLLRTSFRWEGMPVPHQIVHRRGALALESVDWSRLPGALQEASLDALLQREIEKPFDFTKPSLFRVVVVKLGPDRHAIASIWHLSIVDGWSIQALLREVLSLYSRARRGETTAAGEPREFKSYVAWLRTQDFSAGIAHGQQAITEVAPPTTAGRWAAAGLKRAGRFSKLTRATLGRALRSSGPLPSVHRSLSAGALEKTASSLSVTFNTLVQGAWSLMLAAATRDEKVWLFTVHSARNAAVSGIDEIIGPVANPLFFSADLTDAPVGAWLAGMQASYFECMTFANTPVSRYFTPFGKFRYVHYFDNFDFLGAFAKRAALGDLTFEGAHTRVNVPDRRGLLQTALFPVRVGSELRVNLGYSRDFVSDADAALLLAQYEAVLDAIAASPSVRARELVRVALGGSEPPSIVAARA